MKKLIIMAIMLALFLPMIATADSWSVTIPDDSGNYEIVNIIIDDNKFYVASVEVDGSVAGYPYSETTGLYLIEMEDGPHKAMTIREKLIYELVPGGATLCLDRSDPFEPRFSDLDGGFSVKSIINVFSEIQKENEITVPSGVYIAGEDFPAGTYRIELVDEDKGGVILLYESKNEVNTAFAYLYEYQLSKYSGSSVVGKIEIKDGNALSVRNTTVVLMPYEGLK